MTTPSSTTNNKTPRSLLLSLSAIIIIPPPTPILLLIIIMMTTHHALLPPFPFYSFSLHNELSGQWLLLGSVVPLDVEGVVPYLAEDFARGDPVRLELLDSTVNVRDCQRRGLVLHELEG